MRVTPPTTRHIRRRQAGIYARRILKGEKAANLPVHAAEQVLACYQSQGAKALGITVPHLLSSAPTRSSSRGTFDTRCIVGLNGGGRMTAHVPFGGRSGRYSFAICRAGSRRYPPLVEYQNNRSASASARRLTVVSAALHPHETARVSPVTQCASSEAGNT